MVSQAQVIFPDTCGGRVILFYGHVLLRYSLQPVLGLLGAGVLESPVLVPSSSLGDEAMTPVYVTEGDGEVQGFLLGMVVVFMVVP